MSKIKVGSNVKLLGANKDKNVYGIVDSINKDKATVIVNSNDNSYIDGIVGDLSITLPLSDLARMNKNNLYVSSDNKAVFVYESRLHKNISFTELFRMKAIASFNMFATDDAITENVVRCIPLAIANYLATKMKDTLSENESLELLGYCEFTLSERITGMNTVYLPGFDFTHAGIQDVDRYCYNFNEREVVNNVINEMYGDDIEKLCEILYTKLCDYKCEKYNGVILNNADDCEYLLVIYILSLIQYLNIHKDDEEVEIPSLGTFKIDKESIKLTFDKEYKCECKVQ